MILCSPQNVLASPAVLERVLSVCQQRKPKEVLTARAQGKAGNRMKALHPKDKGVISVFMCLFSLL